MLLLVSAGAEPLSLNEAVEIALEQSLAVDESRVQKALGVQSVAEGVEGFFPRITTSTSASDSTFAELGSGMWGTDIRLTQPVLDATTIFGLLAGIQQAGISKAQSIQTIARLIKDVQNAYYDLAKSQALLLSAERQHERTLENSKVTTRRFELKDVSNAEMLRAEANLLKAEQDIITAETNLENNQRILSDLLGFEEIKEFKAEALPDAEEPYSLSSTVISAELLERNPDFDVLLRQAKSTDLTYWGTWASILPSLNLTASRSWTQDEWIPSDWDTGANSIGLTVSFPIADVTGKALSLNRARLNRKQSRISLARQELAFRQTLAGLLATQESSYKGWEVAEKNVELSNEVYRLTMRSYELGASSQADLLEVAAELMLAERALVEAQAAYWSSRAELNYFLGSSLED